MGVVAYIGVGSNQGVRDENIERSRRLLESAGVDVRRVSTLYETQAQCRPGQSAPDFLNAAFEIETQLGPQALLELLENIETTMGRVSKGDWAPRVIDLDLLFYGERIIETAILQVPHPEMKNRWFVLKPLADLVPDMVHPVLGKSVKDLLANVLKT